MAGAKVRIVELGPRDGLQNEKILLSVEERAEFIKKLNETGLQNIEVGAFVSPKWVPQMSRTTDVYKKLIGRLKPKTRTISLVPNRQGLDDAISAGANEVAVFSAASDTFSKKNTNATIAESFKRIADIMPLAKKHKMKVRGYLSTCYYCPFEGKIKTSIAAKLIVKLFELGVYEVSVGDTIGAATPNEVKALNKIIIKEIGAKNLAMHFHDTRGTALANILQSLDQGIRTFDSSIGGLGGCPYAPGAAGNVATEDVVYMLNGMGMKSGVNLSQLQNVRAWIEAKVGRRLHGAQPFVKSPL